MKLKDGQQLIFIKIKLKQSYSNIETNIMIDERIFRVQNYIN